MHNSDGSNTAVTVRAYHVPQSVSTATALLAQGEAAVIAGGTDLVPQQRTGSGTWQPVLVSIRRIKALRGVREQAGQLWLGPLTTVSELLCDPLIARYAPVLTRAADCFASSQIRNAATLGGNICNASPAGDLLVPLMLLDAEVELSCSRDGVISTRCLPIEEFLVGPGSTQRQPAELLTGIRLPLVDAARIFVFEKFGTRPALDIATVSVGLLAVAAGDCLQQVRVALGAVAPVVLRARAAEAVLEGRRLDNEVITAAVAAALEEINPIDDVRASGWYRSELVRNLLTRVLRNAVAS